MKKVEKKKTSKKILSLFLALFMLSAVSFATGEYFVWDCSNCESKGNTGNFCGSCGSPAPWMDQQFAGNPIKVGIITLDPSESKYREANVKDMKDTFSADNGYDVSVVSSSDSNKQMEAFNNFISSGVKYILLCPVYYSTGWDEVLLKAKNAGICVIIFDVMINCEPDLYTAAVISDFHKQGETAVELLESLNLSEYKILHIQGAIGSEAQIGRSEPLQEKCAADEKWSIIRYGTGGDSWDPDEAHKIAAAALEAGEDFNVVYAETDSMAYGVMTALDAAGKTHGAGGEVVVLGFDCNKWALRKLLAGELNFDIQNSPFQAGLIDRMIKTLETGGAIAGLDSRRILINEDRGFDARTITAEDVEKFGLGD